MPKVNKADSELAARFRAFMAGYPEAPVRNTFGSPCAYVNGNMAVGAHGTGWFVRLGPEDSAALAAAGGGTFMPMPGRPMTGFMTLPPAVAGEEPQLRHWVDRALAYAASLPPKK